jgi:uncharacterized phosphosugar-binding protein
MNESAQALRPAIQYLRVITGTLDGYRTRLDEMAAAADRAAERLVAGGHLYAVADEEGFVHEACGRSGGVRQIRNFHHDPHPTLTGQDVILAGALGGDPDRLAAELRGYRDTGALVILFGSPASSVRQAADLLLPNGMPAGTNPVIRAACRAEPVCPTAGVANIAGMWVFTGELVAACTRRGRALVMYQSGGMPGGGARNNAYRNLMFHEDLDVPAVGPGALGGQFLDEMAHCFARLEQQYHLFFQGGALMAQSLDAGRRVWVSGNAHHFAAQNRMPGDPRLFSLNMNDMPYDEAVAAFHREDTFAYMGYYSYPDRLVEDTRRAGMHSVWLQGGCETGHFAPRPQEIVVDCGWERGDACVVVPGYDIPVIPPSGVVQTAALWMLVAEAASQVRAEYGVRSAE